MSKPRQLGLTLLEVLVVLTLLSMISTVMFQGYAYMMGSYQRLRDRQVEEFREALVGNWWRSSLEALVPYNDNELRFSASASSMQGASFAPLLGEPGVAGAISWRLESNAGRSQLFYAEPPREPLVIREWVAGEEVSFQYLSESGSWLDEWRPGTERQIPEAIRLKVLSGSGRSFSSLTAVIDIRKSQHIPSTVILYGRD